MHSVLVCLVQSPEQRGKGRGQQERKSPKTSVRHGNTMLGEASRERRQNTESADCDI